MKNNLYRRRSVPDFFYFLSVMTGITSLAMIPSLIIAAANREGRMAFSFALSLGIGVFMSLPVLLLTGKREARTADPGRSSVPQGLLLVCLAWVFSCLLGALPFLFSGALPDFPSAVFESVSGFTTTGATIFADVESLPCSLLFWRAATQWLGGMGTVVLIAALAPVLRYIYLGLTFVETLLLRLGGMTWFDAVTHAFSTMATGGFSTRNGGIAAWNSPFLEWVIIVFMFIAGFNFNLIFALLSGKGREIPGSSEAKGYFRIIAAAAVLCAVSLAPGLGTGTSIRLGLFQSVSVLSTTGFSAADQRLWPPVAQCCLFLLMFIGGCSSSAAGGIKVIRHVILCKQAGNEVKRLLYPRGVFSITLNKRESRKDVVYGAAGFVFLYLLLVLAAALLLCTTGLDIFSGFNIGLLAAGNIGIGFVNNMEEVLGHFPAYAKWALSFVMIAGRLELWTVFALFARGIGGR
ncbi:MAG: TrkH family potassium uptake protein [Treponema sp.]|jgi:trk system potassium uptake protein TrkH|nr:TrkH family potassium uptake protein [Treponema sp.]